MAEYDTSDNERDVESRLPNTTQEGDGKSLRLGDVDESMSYCNKRIAGLMVAQTGIVATDRKPRGFEAGLATSDRGRWLGKLRGPCLRRGS
jgi:hypothetical protein